MTEPKRCVHDRSEVAQRRPSTIKPDRGLWPANRVWRRWLVTAFSPGSPSLRGETPIDADEHVIGQRWTERGARRLARLLDRESGPGHYVQPYSEWEGSPL